MGEVEDAVQHEFAILKPEFATLKSGVGMTLDDFAKCPRLLALLGTRDAAVAVDRVLQIIERMGDNRYCEALSIALGINYYGERRSLVGRREWLMNYKKVKTTDTIKAWELKGQGQFLATLKATEFETDFSEVFVIMGTVENRGLVTLTATLDGNAQPAIARGAYSVPILLYQMPTERRLMRLVLALTFDAPPSDVWALDGSTTASVTGSDSPRILAAHPDMDGRFYSCTWPRPVPGMFYSLSWR